MAEMDSDLLDLPLGVKVPVKPSSKAVLSRGKLGEKLQRPSPFNLDDPYIHHTSLQYNCLHDPHLQDYHKRKDILRMLKRQGVITSGNDVVCTAKEFNDYRHYLTRIKLQSEKILEQQEKSKETPLKSGKLRRGKIDWDKGQIYPRAELGQEDASTATDFQSHLDNTAAEAEKLQELVEAIVYKVFARLKVPRDQRVSFLRNVAQGIRGSIFSRCKRTEAVETPLDHRQEMEMVAKELLAMVLESLADHLESKASEPGRAARQEKPVDGGVTQADTSKEAETAFSDTARIQAALDNLTIHVVKNVHCLLKSMIASQFEGDASCECTEILELPKGKVSNRQMQPGFPGASKHQSQETSMRLKLPPLGPQLHAEGTGYAKAKETKNPEMVKGSLVGERNPATSGNVQIQGPQQKKIVKSVLGRIFKCLPVQPPEENF